MNGTEKNNHGAAGRLHALLADIAGGLDEIYDCLRRQEKALVKWDLPAFVDTVRDQRRLARENIRREERRIELVAEIVGEERAAEMSLLRLAESLGGPWPERFSRSAERIRRAADRVAEMKKQNEMLIGRSRDVVDSQLRTMLELANLNRNTYGQRGRRSGRTSMHKVLDQRA